MIPLLVDFLEVEDVLDPTVETAEVVELSVGEVIAPLMAIVGAAEDWLVLGIFGIVYLVFVDDLNRPVPPGPIFDSKSAAEDEEEEEDEELDD